MKTFFAIAIVGITTISNAETLSFPSFRIEIEDGWMHQVEQGVQSHRYLGELISIYHPDRSGMLKMRSYSAPGSVSEQTLRNMTNVDASTPLKWQNWGDYAGYQHDYSEEGSFYRQWWLTDEQTIIFVVYDSTAASTDIEIDEINRIVGSITTDKP